MSIVVSSCLLGCNCKYNGGNNANERVIEFCKGKDVISICPEQLGDLPTPRPPAEIVNGIVMNNQGENVDESFKLGVHRAMEEIANREIEFAILQSRSPSCGVKQIYDGTFSGRLIPGQGLFARELAKQKIKIVDVEDFKEREEKA